MKSTNFAPMKRYRISEILAENSPLKIGEEINVKGWVRAFRSNRFIQLNDGSCMANIQSGMKRY